MSETTTVSSNGRSSQTTEPVSSKAVFVRTIIPFLLLQFSVGLCASLQVAHCCTIFLGHLGINIREIIWLGNQLLSRPLSTRLKREGKARQRHSLEPFSESSISLSLYLVSSQNEFHSKSFLFLKGSFRRFSWLTLCLV